MSTKPQIELFLENESGTQQVAYPFVESDHVSLSNGMDIDTMIRQDVSMPTVAHEDLGFKVGVGDQDVSSAIVDSSVAEMTIKGKTYQNILPEPSTHVLTNNKEMFKVNEGLDPNVEIVDGVSKSAILKGQTLVNLSEINKFSISGRETKISTSLKKIKNNTVYTRIVYITKNTLTGVNERNNVAQIIGLNADNALFNIDRQIALNETGLVCKECINSGDLSSKLSTSHIRIFGLNTGGVLEGYEIIVEGDYTNQDIPYFEGMQSVKMPVLTTTGKNLFNLPLIQKQSYVIEFDANSITVKNGSNGNISELFGLKHKPNEQYTIIYNREAISGIGVSLFVFNYTDGTIQYANPGTINVSIPGRTLSHISLTYSDIGVSKLYDICIFKGVVNKSDYEPYKSNILTTSEDVVLRSLPNGVKDTLNLMTGEYVQRIGEVVLDGSENWTMYTLDENFPDVAGFYHTRRGGKPANGGVNQNYIGSLPVFAQDRLPGGLTVNEEGVVLSNIRYVKISILKSKLSSIDSNGFKQWLSQNPITIQYELATPVIKTVDLSSSGNWMELTLTGEEEWRDSGNTPYITPSVQPKKGLIPFSNGEFVGVDRAESFACFWLGGGTNAPNGNLVFYHPMVKNAIQMKEFLRNNPQKIYYYVEDGMGCIKQPIFFKDGHIQLSSGADNSLIPTLDYQAKTSNSYVMDLMKTNTKYTMKAKSASGTFTIDGTSYGAGTNGTFTTPTSMTNKLLVMSNKTNTEVMILEGDVTSKTIPYFKGIKSAFEGEDKIEVLSQGKNLFDVNEVQTNDRTRGAWETRIEGNKIYSMRVTSQVSGGEFGAFIQIPVKPSVEYVYKFDFTSTDPNLEDPQVYIYNNSSIWGEVLSGNGGKTTKFTTKANTQFITIGLNYRSGVQKGTEFCTYNAILIETTQTRDYEPYKSNCTKIPLLSPLRSLPNGVCDEIILDRENNKAQIVQRVGKAVFDGSSDEVMWFNTGWTNGDCVACYWDVSRMSLPNKKFGTTNMVCDKLPTVRTSIVANGGIVTGEGIWGEDGSSVMYISLNKTKLTELSVNGFRQWASQNPFTVHYELETPIITEVDLEGFPYIYKDGHIFLNGEVTPVTEIKYSINQSHMIEASNQDLIRQEKKLTNLQRLIGEYVRVDYNSTLLSLELELK